MTKTVHCVKLGRELPALESVPYSGELGQRILDNVSQQAWDMWVQEQALIINHNGLMLANPNARVFLRTEMEKFFFGVKKSTEVNLDD